MTTIDQPIERAKLDYRDESRTDAVDTVLDPLELLASDALDQLRKDLDAELEEPSLELMEKIQQLVFVAADRRQTLWEELYDFYRQMNKFAERALKETHAQGQLALNGLSLYTADVHLNGLLKACARVRKLRERPRTVRETTIRELVEQGCSAEHIANHFEKRIPMGRRSFPDIRWAQGAMKDPDTFQTELPAQKELAAPDWGELPSITAIIHLEAHIRTGIEEIAAINRRAKRQGN